MSKPYVVSIDGDSHFYATFAEAMYALEKALVTRPHAFVSLGNWDKADYDFDGLTADERHAVSDL